ncbi:MAG: FAD-dependent oxidoreductase [Planctomycetota bacterium]|nr:FAD-dependent oxidoreductase [Planctomycetota bacterium]
MERNRVAASSTQAWRCTVCGYIHRGPQLPECCPVCGAHSSEFEPQATEERPAAVSSSAGRVVIVGGGIAGLSAAEAFRRAAPDAGVTLVCKEAELPYYRLNLTRYLAGEVEREDLPVHPASWYAEQRIELLRDAEAAEVDLNGLAIGLRGGKRLPFQTLILTSGAHPFVPPVPGAERAGVLSLRTIADAGRILAAAQPGCRCVCVGGGLLGLETAGGLARRGVDVTVVESFSHLMPSQLDARAGAVLAAHLVKLRIKLRAAVHVKEFAGNERVAGVVLQEGGAALPADLVVLATGVRPNSSLARQAGLTVQKAIVVDNRLRTSHPRVFAAGDAAEHLGVLYGNWCVAQYQGSIAGMNAAGLNVEFGGVPRSHTLKVLGLDTVSIGQFTAPDGSYTVVAAEHDSGYHSFVFRDNLLAGSNLVGDTTLAAAVKKAIENKRDFSGLLAKHPSAADVAAHLAELP